MARRIISGALLLAALLIIPLCATAQVIGGGNTVISQPNRWLAPANECSVGANSLGVALPNTPTYNNGTAGVGATLTSATNTALTVDGVSVLLNDRVLVPGQASAFQNGIYVETQVGTGAVPWILTRDVNSNSSANILTGDSIVCIAGTNALNRGYILNTTPTPFTIGVTNLTYVQFTGSPQLVAGTGINIASNTVSLLNPVACGLGGTGLASGTSGGILGFTGSCTLASSGALTSGAIVLGGGAGSTPTVLGSLGTGTTVLHGNASGSPSFGSVSLTTDVSGILPVGSGGSGAGTFTGHGVLLGEGASAFGATAVGTNGQMFLGASSADPGWQTMSGDATLGTTGGLTLATVNSNVGTFTNATVTTNAKGLVTAVASGSASGLSTTTLTGNSPINLSAANGQTAIISMATPAAATINLPSAAQTSGWRQCVKDGTTNFAANPATIKSPSAGNIDGNTQIVAGQQGQEICFVSDGANWFSEASSRIKTYPVDFGTVDATQFAGADICVKMQNALTALQSATAGGGTVDVTGATGAQTCSVNPFASVPGGGSFVPMVKLGRTTFLTNTTWLIPTRVILKGLMPGCPAIVCGATEWGTVIQASNSFPVFNGAITSISNGSPGVVMLTNITGAYTFPNGQIVTFQPNAGDVLPAPLTVQDFYYVVNESGTCSSSTTCTFNVSTTPGGAAINTTTAGSGVHKIMAVNPVVQVGTVTADSFQNTVSDLSITCAPPNGTGMLAGSIGLFLENGQELSQDENLSVNGCNVDYFVGDASGDVNEWKNWNANDGGVGTLLNTFQCLVVGSTSAARFSNFRFKVATLNGFHCYENNPGGTASLTMVYPLIVITGQANLRIENSYSESNIQHSGVVPTWLSIGMPLSSPILGNSSTGGISAANVSLVNWQSGTLTSPTTSIAIPFITGNLTLQDVTPPTAVTNTLLFNSNGITCTITAAHDGTIAFLVARADGGGISNLRAMTKTGTDCPDIGTF